MSNPWFRLYAEFANDPKVQMMSEAMQRRLVMLFCLRCNGDETLQDDEVTFLLRIDGEEWQQTKAVFVAKGFIDESNNLLNWDKRQFKSDSSTERVSRHRERKKAESELGNVTDETECNVTVTAPEAEAEAEQTQSRAEKKQRPRDDSEYAFAGNIIRVTHGDFANLKKHYHSIPDMRQELFTIDQKFTEDGTSGKYWAKLNSWLGKKHERLVSQSTTKQTRKNVRVV